MRLGKEGPTQQSHDISGGLSDRELTQILRAGPSWGEKELRFTDAALQCAQIRRLSGAGNKHVNILIDPPAKTLGQAVR
jgi:hypothetical protein